MYKYLILLIFFILKSILIYAQIKPAEDSKLNYRIIGFKFPKVLTADNYKIEIASGNYNNEDSFRNNIIELQSLQTNKIVLEVPSFGTSYTWQYSYSINGKSSHSPLFHFSTISVPEIDTNLWRFRVAQPATKYKD